MTLFRQLSLVIPVDLNQSTSNQPDHLIASLPRTSNYRQSCTDLFLHELIISEEEKNYARESPIMKDIQVIETEYTMPIVRQRMKHSEDEHVTGS